MMGESCVLKHSGSCRLGNSTTINALVSKPYNPIKTIEKCTHQSYTNYSLDWVQFCHNKSYRWWQKLDWDDSLYFPDFSLQKR